MRRRLNSHLPADPREVLPALATARGESLAALSRMLSRDDGYLARFVREGMPVGLTARDHRLLADHFGVGERGMGIRDLWADSAPRKTEESAEGESCDDYRREDGREEIVSRSSRRTTAHVTRSAATGHD